MKKKLNLKTSWYSKENWDRVIKDGYLPILAIKNPEIFRNTVIHFPNLAPRYFNNPINPEEYKKHLEKHITYWKLLNTFDVLIHLASATGIVIFTDIQEDPYREILGEFLSKYLEDGVSEYDGN